MPLTYDPLARYLAVQPGGRVMLPRAAIEVTTDTPLSAGARQSFVHMLSSSPATHRRCFGVAWAWPCGLPQGRA